MAVPGATGLTFTFIAVLCTAHQPVGSVGVVSALLGVNPGAGSRPESVPTGLELLQQRIGIMVTQRELRLTAGDGDETIG